VRLGQFGPNAHRMPFDNAPITAATDVSAVFVRLAYAFSSTHAVYAVVRVINKLKRAGAVTRNPDALSRNLNTLAGQGVTRRYQCRAEAAYVFNAAIVPTPVERERSTLGSCWKTACPYRGSDKGPLR